MRKFFCVLATLLLSVSVAFGQGGSETDSHSLNVLILYADDLGFGDCGCYNEDSKIPTPHIDRLAASGMRFTDGHSSSGICTPSRYAMLTGRHHWRDFHGIVNSFGQSVFQPQRLTMPEMMQQHGYTTAAIGKWHLGWDWESVRHKDAKRIEVNRRNRKVKAWGPDAFDWSQPIPGGPLAHGFDHYFGDTVINFPPYCWIEDDRVTEVPDRMIDGSKVRVKEGSVEFRPGPAVADWDPYTNVPVTTRRGVEFIKEQANSDKPFFLYFAFPSPHAPIIPNDRFDGSSQAGPYGDYVVETDEAIGQLLQALEESGQTDRTIVIFSADNGPEGYAYDRDEKYGHWSSHPFRGLKRDIYEGGHHVPLIIRWPGVTEAGSVCDALVSQIDLMATLAGMLDFDLPDDSAEDSHNLMPLLEGMVDSVRMSHVHNTFKDRYAIRHGEWLLVNHKDGYHSGRNQEWEKRHEYPPANGKREVELFHLKEDPGQRYNVADEHQGRVAALQALLHEIQTQGHSAPRLDALGKQDKNGTGK